MPTAIPMWEEEQEQAPGPTEICILENTLHGSSRLLKNQHQGLEAEIQHAKTILGQPEMTAQEGIYSEETLDRAIAFLRTHIEGLWQSHGLNAPIPTIGPGPAGSVDLYWAQPSWRLLVNIPAATNALATFYTDDRGQQKTRGSVDPNKFSVSIAACLMA